MEKDLQVSSLLDVYGAFLSEKQRDLTEQYYNDDYSLAEIAENTGITRQGVQDGIKRAAARLYALEEACHYASRFGRLKALAEEVRAGREGAKEELFALIEEL